MLHNWSKHWDVSVSSSSAFISLQVSVEMCFPSPTFRLQANLKLDWFCFHYFLCSQGYQQPFIFIDENSSVSEMFMQRNNNNKKNSAPISYRCCAVWVHLGSLCNINLRCAQRMTPFWNVTIQLFKLNKMENNRKAICYCTKATKYTEFSIVLKKNVIIMRQ